MDEITFGEVIRSIRKAKGMTQEEVAEGICSTSSLSKMENGSQVPSRQRFQKIMERLGEPGYSYAHFFSSGEAEREQYRREALEALEGGRVERAEELLLWWKKDADSEEDVMERQFWQTAELLWRRIYEAPGPGYRERCMELFSMTRSSFCLQKEWREDNFTRTETLLLNNAGLGFLWEKRYREAAGVFLQLYSINERTGKKRSDYRKKKAVLCGLFRRDGAVVGCRPLLCPRNRLRPGTGRRGALPAASSDRHGVGQPGRRGRGSVSGAGTDPANRFGPVGAGGGGKARFLFSAAAARDFHSVVAISHSVL